jgi:hypothetical protein
LQKLRLLQIISRSAFCSIFSIAKVCCKTRSFATTFAKLRQSIALAGAGVQKSGRDLQFNSQKINGGGLNKPLSEFSVPLLVNTVLNIIEETPFL